jgi:hypothetical protein
VWLDKKSYGYEKFLLPERLLQESIPSIEKFVANLGASESLTKNLNIFCLSFCRFQLVPFFNPLKDNCIVEWLMGKVRRRDVWGSGLLGGFWGKKIWGI